MKFRVFTDILKFYKSKKLVQSVCKNSKFRPFLSKFFFIINQTLTNKQKNFEAIQRNLEEENFLWQLWTLHFGLCTLDFGLCTLPFNGPFLTKIFLEHIQILTLIFYDFRLIRIKFQVFTSILNEKKLFQNVCKNSRFCLFYHLWQINDIHTLYNKQKNLEMFQRNLEENKCKIQKSKIVANFFLYSLNYSIFCFVCYLECVYHYCALTNKMDEILSFYRHFLKSGFTKK